MYATAPQNPVPLWVSLALPNPDTFQPFYTWLVRMKLGWDSPIGRPSTALYVFAINTWRALGRHGSKAAFIATFKVDVLKVEGMDMAREVTAQD